MTFCRGSEGHRTDANWRLCCGVGSELHGRLHIEVCDSVKYFHVGLKAPDIKHL